jgi:hypothetical protein
MTVGTGSLAPCARSSAAGTHGRRRARTGLVAEVGSEWRPSAIAFARL